MIIFVTGTGTDIGKTVVTAALASRYRGHGYDVVVAKPVQTGGPTGHGDIFTVRALTDVDVAEYVRYPEPLAPNLAARRAGVVQVERGELVDWVRQLDDPERVVLVEGAGGLLVRLADDFTLANIAADVGAPIIVVTSLGLGSLNWAELTVREAQRRGLQVAGLIGGSMPANPDLATQLNIEELEKVTGVRLWGCIPQGAGAMDVKAFSGGSRNWLRDLPSGPSSLVS